MDLHKTSYTFTDGRIVTVSESTWEASSIRTRIEEQARTDRARLNGSGDPVLFFFLENFYGFLASCSSGDVPSAEEALSLSDQDLDSWFAKLVDVNPDLFVKTDRSVRGEVIFRDGLRLEIVSSFLPSVSMKRARLEEEGLRLEADRDHPKDVFSVYLYPLLASCSLGEVPDREEARRWPEGEIYKWKDAIEAINPHLFGSDEQKEARTAAEARSIEKKRRRRPEKSPRG